MGHSIHLGAVEDWLQEIPADYFTAAFCDPPYGLGAVPDPYQLLEHWMAGRHYDTGRGFMNKAWDVVPGPHVWRELCRTTKPGGLLFAFAGSRTYDLMGLSIRLGGWEVVDTILWVYGSGWPKGANIGRQIDAAAGAEREVVEVRRNAGDRVAYQQRYGEYDVTAPATPEAAEWDDHNSQLKPAYEPVIVARKPSDLPFYEQALRYGTGAYNLGATRIKHSDRPGRPKLGGQKFTGNAYNNGEAGYVNRTLDGPPEKGRYPANLALGHLEACEDDDAGRWACAPGCPVQVLGDQSGETVSAGRPHRRQGGFWKTGGDGGMTQAHGDRGTAARFYYQAKASTREREAGLEGLPEHLFAHSNAGQAAIKRGEADEFEGTPGLGYGQIRTRRNDHPTVKPLALVRWLAALLTPPESWLEKAVLAVPYAGSGSEMIGAALAGWRNVEGCEREASYKTIAEARLAWWLKSAQRYHTTDPRKIMARAYGEAKRAPLPVMLPAPAPRPNRGDRSPWPAAPLIQMRIFEDG